jgi:hypothetical protein
MSHQPTKHESANEPGLYFWAERNPGPVESYCVMAKARRGPATEAHDDWLAHFKDADEIAQGMALTMPDTREDSSTVSVS